MSPARALVAAVVTAATCALVLLGAGPPHARAHDQLVSTTPADGGTVGSAPAQVDLVLSQPALALGTRMVVRGPDGAEVSRGAAELRNTTVTQPLRADLPAGAYTVLWRVTSADGHPISGQFTFTLTTGTRPAPASSGPAAAEQPGSAGADELSGSHLLHGIAVGALLLLTAGALLVRQLRARS
jgi:methionine-rich copper-binding protein CopC